MRRALFGVASTLALVIVGPSLAAEIAAEATVPVTVDPVVVLGARTEKQAGEVPASVSVITAVDLEDRLAGDIKAVIQYEPGVSVRSSPSRFGAALGTTGRDGNAGFNIRGLEGNRVLITVDGVRLPDGFVFGAQSVGRGDYLDLDLIKRVEILRGPSSALYGSDGLTGAVSFTTKDPSDFLKGNRAWGGRLRGAYGSADDSVGGTAVAAGRTGAWSGLLAYTYREAGSQETQGTNASANTDRTLANPQDILSRSLLGKLVWQPSDQNRLRLSAEHFDRNVKTDVLSGIAKPPLGASSVLRLKAADTTKRDRVTLDQQVDFSEGPIKRLIWSAYLQTSTTLQFTAEDRNLSADRTRRNTFDNRVIGISTQLESAFGLAGLQHRLIYGFDASRTRQTGLRDGSVPPAGEVFPTRAFPTTDYSLVGAFLQDEWVLLDGRLSLYPALRFDHYALDPRTEPLSSGFVPARSKGGRVSPKLGLVLRPSESLRLFVNYAQGFKAPAPSQVNNAFANPIQNYRSIPNPDLKPETSEAIEGGVRWVRPSWTAEIVGFSGVYQNFIEQLQISGAFTPTNPGVFQVVNLTRAKIQGVEARARVKLQNGFSGFAAASYAKGDSYAPNKTPLDSVDPIKVTAGVSFRAQDGRYGGELAVTHSERKSAGRVAQVCTSGCYRPGAFTTADLTGFWRFNEALTARAGVFNLTDQTYAWWSDVRGLSSSAVSRDAYTQPGRNISLSLTYDF